MNHPKLLKLISSLATVLQGVAAIGVITVLITMPPPQETIMIVSVLILLIGEMGKKIIRSKLPSEDEEE